MITLVGITGPAQHGKNTVGDMLKDHLPTADFFAYADALKAVLHNSMLAFQGPMAFKEGEQEFTTSKFLITSAFIDHLVPAFAMYHVEKPVDSFLEILEKHHEDFKIGADGQITFTSSWRKLYQLTGTEWGRQTVNNAFWIDPFLPSGNAIVTDVRGHGDASTEPLKNIEAISIIGKGGVVVKVVDPRKGAVVRDHHSEAGIDEQYITHIIINDGSLDDLRAKVGEFVYSHLMRGEQ